MSRATLTLTMLIVALLLPATAQAYIDPGTGSYLLQALVAGAAGALLAARGRWRQIKGFFTRERAAVETPERADSQERPEGK